MTLTKLVTVCAGLSTASDMPALRAELIRTVSLLGFDSFNLSIGKRNPIEFMTEPTLTTWSESDLASYVEDGWAGRDPLLNYTKTPGAPLFWTPEQWAGTAHHVYADYLRSASIACGLTVPLVAAKGTFGAMTLLAAHSVADITETKQAAAVIAMMTSARATGLGAKGPDLPATRLRLLSAHQTQILGWIAAGKSNSEIAAILGQKRRTIDYHVAEILRKLGVGSRIQAAAIHARAAVA